MDPAREPIRVNRDFFIKKCCPDIHKLNFTSNTKLSSLSIEEWTALINLKNRNDFVIKVARQSFASSNSTKKNQFSDPTFYTSVNKDLTPANSKVVKDTIQELITKQEVPITQNLIITTPTTSFNSNLKVTNLTTKVVQLF